MSKSTLLSKNVQEIMKLQTGLKLLGEHLENLFNRIETEAPEVKESLSEPLKKTFNVLWDSVDILQRNTEEMMGIDQAIEDNLN